MLQIYIYIIVYFTFSLTQTQIPTSSTNSISFSPAPNPNHPSTSASDASSDRPVPRKRVKQEMLTFETPYTNSSDKKKRIDERLLGLVYKDLLPFSVVDGEGFKQICQEMNPKYKLPSR